MLKTKLVSLLLATMFAVCGNSYVVVDTTEGTKTVSGSLSGNYGVRFEDKMKHNIRLGTDVGMGYFVWDNIMLGASGVVDWNYSKGFRLVGGKVFNTYFFDTYSMAVPFVGLNVSPRYKFKTKKFNLSAGIHSGTLLSLSEAVALELGLGVDVGMKISDKDVWSINAPFGFMGVRAFF